jgi:hypothetical protein
VQLCRSAAAILQIKQQKISEVAIPAALDVRRGLKNLRGKPVNESLTSRKFGRAQK